MLCEFELDSFLQSWCGVSMCLCFCMTFSRVLNQTKNHLKFWYGTKTLVQTKHYGEYFYRVENLCFMSSLFPSPSSSLMMGNPLLCDSCVTGSSYDCSMALWIFNSYCWYYRFWNGMKRHPPKPYQLTLCKNSNWAMHLTSFLLEPNGVRRHMLNCLLFRDRSIQSIAVLQLQVQFNLFWI